MIPRLSCVAYSPHICFWSQSAWLNILPFGINNHYQFSFYILILVVDTFKNKVISFLSNLCVFVCLLLFESAACAWIRYLWSVARSSDHRTRRASHNAMQQLILCLSYLNTSATSSVTCDFISSVTIASQWDSIVQRAAEKWTNRCERRVETA